MTDQSHPPAPGEKDRDERWRQLVLKADSMLSLLRHRAAIRWGEPALPTEAEVDAVIGRLRRAYETNEP